MVESRFTEPPRYTFLQSMQSLWNTTKATLTAGTQGISSPELFKDRLKVCETCDRRVAHGVVWQCGVCNCLLHLKAGASQSVCPLYRWPGDEKFKPAF